MNLNPYKEWLIFKRTHERDIEYAQRRRQHWPVRTPLDERVCIFLYRIGHGLARSGRYLESHFAPLEEMERQERKLKARRV